MPTLNEAIVRQQINTKFADNYSKAITAQDAREVANLLVDYTIERNFLTLIEYTDTTITLAVGSNVEVEEGPSIYPSLNITFL
ncbi:hypothetical protein [Runella salmonicolor]|uniref:Uncharacterized protein n=1 Tax=Runella salmonicolor TaxID=2950278 RepID=A0ABT1FSQ1_9BACT|nr:hypothetical protein [Runella salmonicolor]MCP1384790.1 hypothetical protein [Runella salmonicolor]